MSSQSLNFLLQYGQVPYTNVQECSTIPACSFVDTSVVCKGRRDKGSVFPLDVLKIIIIGTQSDSPPLQMISSQFRDFLMCSKATFQLLMVRLQNK